MKWGKGWGWSREPEKNRGDAAAALPPGITVTTRLTNFFWVLRICHTFSNAIFEATLWSFCSKVRGRESEAYWFSQGYTTKKQRSLNSDRSDYKAFFKKTYIFKSLSESRWWHMPGARAPKSFVASFMNLKLKRKSKEVHTEVNKSKAGMRLQDVLTSLLV